MALILGLGAVVGWFMTRPAKLTPMLAGVIQQATGAQVDLDRASLSWSGRLTLEGLSLRVRGVQGPGGRLARADTVTLAPDWGSVLAGAPRPRRVRVRGGRIWITENSSRGRFNYEMLHPAGSPWPDELPEIVVHQMRVTFGEVREGVYEKTRRLALRAHFARTTGKGRRYHLTADTVTDRFSPDRFTGTLDLESRTLTLMLHGFRFDGPQRHFLPRAWRVWWDRLEPTGKLPTLGVRLGVDSGGWPRLETARLTLKGVSLSPLAGWIGSDRGPRLTGVVGRLVLKKNTVEIKRLTGRVAGIDYTISGHHGMSPEAPFDLQLRTRPFTIDREPAMLPVVGGEAKAIYDRFHPRGTFALQLNVSRARIRGPVEVSGALKLLGARAMFHKFAYPVGSLTGTIRFTRREATLDHLVGKGPSGARIQVTGSVAPLNDQARIAVHVVGERLPVDKHLLAAMEPRSRAMMATMFDLGAARKLEAAGLIRLSTTLGSQKSKAENRKSKDDRETPSPVSISQSPSAISHPPTAPGFELGGVISRVEVQIDCRSDDPRYTVTATVHPQGLGGMMAFWPYPLTAANDEATLTLAKKRITIHDLQLRGPTGAMASIEGTIDAARNPPGQAHLIPRLKLTGISAPMDRLLTASLDPPRDRWVRRLGFEGTVRGQGQVTADPRGRVTFQIEGHAQGRARPGGADGALFKPVEGDLTLSRDGAEIHQLTAGFGDMILSVKGAADWVHGDHPALNLTADASALPLDRSLMGLIPKEMPGRARIAAAMDRYHPRGVADAHLAVFSRPKSKAQSPGTEKKSVPATPPPSRVRPLRANTNRPNAESQQSQAASPKAPAPAISPPPSAIHDRPSASSNRQPWPIGYDLTLKPKHLALDLRGERVKFDPITGRVHARPGRIELRRLAGQAGNMRGQIEGVIHTDPRDPPDQAGEIGKIDLRFDAESDRLGPATRAMLPRPVAALFQRLKLAGGYHLTQGRWTADPAITKGPSQRLTAQLNLPGIRGEAGGLAFTNLTGEARVHAVRFAGERRPKLTLALEAKHLRVWDRVIAPLHLGLGTTDRGRTLTIDPIRASVYGGTLVGRGRVDLGASPMTYRMSLAIHDAAMKAMTRPEQTAPPAKDTSKGQEKGGRVSLGVSVTGPVDDPGRRRGGVILQVRDARLFHNPMELGLLQAMNLTMPAAGSFDQADARGVIHGDHLLLNRLSLRAPSLMLVGGGAVSLKDHRLNLFMVARNPDALNLGALSDLLNVFKDQLMGLRITGSLDDPQPDVVSFSSFRQAWSEVFGGPPPRKVTGDDP